MAMDKVTIKCTKKVWTVHVPESQIAIFDWILQEGLAGLGMIDFDDQSQPIVTQGHLDKWNGVDWIWK